MGSPSYYAHDAGESTESIGAFRVSSMPVRVLCEGAALANVAAGALMSEAGMDVGRLRDPRAWFSVDEFDRLLVAAATLAGDQAFGLHWAERSPMHQYDQLVLLGATAPTLRAAIECALRFQPLLTSRHEYRFTESPGHCSMVCDALASSEHGFRTRTEFLLVATRRLLAYFGAAPGVLRVGVPYARPSYGAEYDRLLGPTIDFGETHARTDFAPEYLDRVRAHHNLELHHVLRERVDHLLHRTLSQLTFSERTEAAIRLALPHALSMAEAARALDVSERTMRRMLERENATYSDVLERVRRQSVESLLSRGKQSNKELAAALGYSGVSAFHRAFRRWTGDTPGRQRAARKLP